MICSRLWKQRNSTAEQIGISREKNRCAHKANEQVQTSARMVVYVYSDSQHCAHLACLWVLQWTASIAMVGSPAGLWSGIFFHSSNWDHHCNNKSSTVEQTINSINATVTSFDPFSSSSLTFLWTNCFPILWQTATRIEYYHRVYHRIHVSRETCC